MVVQHHHRRPNGQTAPHRDIYHCTDTDMVLLLLASFIAEHSASKTEYLLT